ncbi:unnamed protein product [Tilletia laevis]|uniref:Uncharacterized protein n=4 Tax=Tilletia TaxID=13289 RepID=A0A8X7N0V1_9BASI|nr:hypothetical protein CF336_g9045 [Tilletia laevis]KAE8193870.1 hypothetical protein CF328_g4914 [Tilletia controversa]KAE8263730.1 hypothetical protein A4X03_0g1465 [Tilletia caries]KAE8206370.1 hypothetical protein CF335_g1943 [Tilletia laevis]KAE8255736.1 hypothetical protein A4X06_0g278 [Tilletia controversa]
MAPSALGLLSTTANTYDASASRRIASYARRASNVISWADADVNAFAAVIDDAGAFNGTCAGDPTLESVPSGSCAAAYVDVTTYCCGAVGGRLRGMTTSANSTSSNSTSTSTSTASGSSDDDDDDDRDLEPTCHTTSYRTMLMCYDDLVHNSCNLSLSPSGICKSNGTSDTSTFSSSAAPSRLRTSPPGWAWTRGAPSSGTALTRRATAPSSKTRTASTSITASQYLVWTLLASSMILSAVGVHQL